MLQHFSKSLSLFEFGTAGFASFSGQSGACEKNK
jgi:hypothetical protein